MNQRSYPLWLLRDWPAFIGFLVSFWTFILAGFIAGRKAARGKRVSEAELQTLFQLYARAESRLDHAIWRQAWRACGYSARHAEYAEFPPPKDAHELNDRFLKYNQALHEMEGLVVAYADDLRRRFNLSKADIGDPNAWRDPLRLATKTSRATSPGFAGGGKQLARLTSLSCLATGEHGLSRRSAAKAEGGLAFITRARGPPQLRITNISCNPLKPSAGTRTYAPYTYTHTRARFPPHPRTHTPHSH